MIHLQLCSLKSVGLHTPGGQADPDLCIDVVLILGAAEVHVASVPKRVHTQKLTDKPLVAVILGH